MQVERVGSGVVCPKKMQINGTKNCSPIKSQNTGDSFTSNRNKSVSFGSGEGMGIGMLAGWAAGVILATVALPATAAAAAVATAAGIAGAAGGATIGDKLTGEDKK